jgi:radical S-adenosyl methionine domain-containing protein 2
MVVNLHVTERCNFQCRYCFGQWGLASGQSSNLGVFTDTDAALEIISQLARHFSSDRGLRFNFVGGEPGLLSNIADLIVAARSLGARTSYVTNGLMLRRFDAAWTATNVDVVGVSIDSPLSATNRQIGRMTAGGRVFSLEAVGAAIDRVRAAGDVSVKVNTVVSSWNVHEDFSDCIALLRPDRWKVLKMLPVHTLDGVVDDERFADFVERHRDVGPLVVAEDNDQMTGSYVMVDPMSRFFWYADSPGGGYHYSRPIAEVGVSRAFDSVPLDTSKFAARYSVGDGSPTSPSSRAKTAFNSAPSAR